MGKSGPKPPPDYTKEKKQIRLDTEADYKKKADKYNEAVKSYNDSLTNFGNTYSNLSGGIGGLTYSDLYDDPNTAVNENPYAGFNTQLGNLTNSLGNLDFSMEKPTFNSSVNSEYGNIGITNIPDLLKVNTNKYDNLSNNISNLSGTLSGLKKQRENEVSRINDYRKQGLGSLAGFSTQLGQLGIADENQMNQLERDLSALNVGRTSFSSPILNQMFPDGFTQFDSQYSGLTQGLGDLRKERQTELDRINTYEQGLLNDADAYRNTLGGLTIADETGINDLIGQIEDRNRQAGRFSSELGFDFNQETGELSDLLRDVNQLSGERQDELSRISRAERDYLNQARALEGSAETGSIYSAAGIDALEDQLRDLRQNIGGFTSQLDYDFGDSTGAMNDTDIALASLNEQRQDALDSILSQITGASGSALSGLEAYDETGMRNLASQLTDAGGELSRFSGGRVGDISGQLDTAAGAIETRMNELTEARNALETRAQALLEQVNNASYYGTDDLGGNQGEFDALNAEVELYNAQQALDEIQSAQDRLNSERQRLEQDAEAVAERDRLAKEDILSTVGASGVPEFQNFSEVDPITLQAYMQMLADQEEEEYANSVSPSAFAQNVMRA